MTGPEHYRQAERLVVQCHHFTYGDGADPVTGAALAAEAQVHATLALVAATALAAPSTRASVRTINAWHDAAGAKPTEVADPVAPDHDEAGGVR